MNSSDKRSMPRYETNINALVHPKAGKSWLCNINDYCGSGMLLVEQEGGRSRRGMPGIDPGESVGIHFSVPLDNKDQHFRLEGKIVRVMESGVGINFPLGMDDRALSALISNSGKVLAHPRTPNNKTAGNYFVDGFFKEGPKTLQTLQESIANGDTSWLNRMAYWGQKVPGTYLSST